MSDFDPDGAALTVALSSSSLFSDLSVSSISVRDLQQYTEHTFDL